MAPIWLVWLTRVASVSYSTPLVARLDRASWRRTLHQRAGRLFSVKITTRLSGKPVSSTTLPLIPERFLRVTAMVEDSCIHQGQNSSGSWVRVYSTQARFL